MNERRRNRREGGRRGGASRGRARCTSLDLREDLTRELAICRTLAVRQDPGYGRAAARWVGRLRAEAGASSQQACDAAAALVMLRFEPHSEQATRQLDELLAGPPAATRGA